MDVQVVYNNVKTCEHEHYGSTIAEVQESFEGIGDHSIQNIKIANLFKPRLGIPPLVSTLTIEVGFATTTVSRVEYNKPLDIPVISSNVITFQTEKGVESCPHCKKEVK